MSRAPFLSDWQSDHLFLLIGTNPLPNWVAARLLLRNGGQIYLVHSHEVQDIARRLSTVLIKQGYRQPEYVSVGDASDSVEIYRAIERRIKKIKSGEIIGFNYTGGTKVMSVHGYQAVLKNLRQGDPDPVLSYLDARTLTMRFDGYHSPVFVGLAPETCLTINEMLSLHDAFQLNEPNRDPVVWPVIEELVKMHSTPGGYQKWGRFVRNLRPDHTLEWNGDFYPVAEALAQGNLLSATLEEIVQQDRWPFRTASHLINWLSGIWLESYVLGLLKTNQKKFRIHDYGQDITPQWSAPIQFQLDVAATRGYQLYIFSCYSGQDKVRAKLKLFEAYIRARQIGGEEAGAALICMSDDPMSIETDIAQTVYAGNRIKVFGRRELKDLGKHLEKWFLTDIQEWETP